MPLYLTETDVVRLLTMPEAVDAVESAFRSWGEAGDHATNEPRRRFFLPKGVFHHMAAALPDQGVMGTKTYASFGGKTRFFVQLFSTETGELLAYLEADKLGQMRTGAATGVATRYLARTDVTRVALFGAGWQAKAQAEAIMVARPDIREFQVYSRNFVPREKFCHEMTRKLGVRFTPMDSPEAAARTTHILVCATTTQQPYLKAEWLSPGDFVAAVGANRLTAQEIEEEVVARSSVVAVDDLDQARLEASELLFAHEHRKSSWSRLTPLAEIVAGKRPGRTTHEEITLFKSLGVALEDIAVAKLVYEKAKAEGIGTSLPEPRP